MGKDKKIKGYKGFNPDMTCRDFKYEVGKEYQTDKAKTCETGFHFCENPFDVWGYYPPCNEKGQLNRFCEVEGSCDIDNSHSDKISSSHIKINAEIGLQGIINAVVKFILDKVSRSGSKHSATTGNYAHSVTMGNSAHSVTMGYSARSVTTGDCAHSATTGDYAHSATTGECARSATAGNYARSVTTGNSARSVTTGNRAHSATTGNYAHSATTGNRAHSVTTGNYAHSVTMGNSARSVTTGNYAHSTVKGQEAIAAALGKGSMAKGSLGCWIVIAEYDDFNGEFSPIKCVKAFKVDGEKIKPDTFYKLENGEVVEVKD